MDLNTYRVWFTDGSVILVNADNKDDAWNEAIETLDGMPLRLDHVEQLN